MDKQTFIDRATEVHGDKYLYELDDTVIGTNKIEITCKIHGKYLKKVSAHLRGSGCNKCLYKDRSLSQQDFLERATARHGDRFDYSKVNYQGQAKKVTIICKEHGEYLQTPASHYENAGCRSCFCELKQAPRISREDWIDRMKRTPWQLVEEKLPEVITSKTKLSFLCEKHGNFSTNPNKISQNKGCRRCGYERLSRLKQETQTGWSYTDWHNAGIASKNFRGFKVYIVKCWDDNEHFYKIGRTYNKVNSRLGSPSQLPYKYEIQKLIHFADGHSACIMEENLKRLHSDLSYVPQKSFHGQYECFQNIKSSDTWEFYKQ